ncbi:MAG: beta-phosphoglucomutase [Clostridia bacterium]|nr:beta-phosphoglucomutase [Clostridia bacterium]
MITTDNCEKVGIENVHSNNSLEYYQAAIFDLDGVVVDTAKYHYLAWKRLAREFGFDFTEDDNEQFKGVSRMRCMELLASMAGLNLSDEEKVHLADLKNTWYVEYISNMNKDEILPGFLSFITDLREKGYKTALASASKNAGLILERLEIKDCFDSVVDGNDVQRSKPDPQVFEMAASRLGIDQERCIVFEDAQAGIDAAKAAKMTCIGIGDPNILTGSDLVIPGFENMNIRGLLKKLL